MKEFTDADIDAMVAEVQDLIKSTQEDLVKSAGKKIASAKEGGNGSVPVPGKGLGKDESPMAKEASDEASAPPEKDAAAPESDSGSDSAPSDGPDSAPADDAAPASPDAGQDPAAAQGGDEPSLEQQYAQLDDNELQMHLQALKAVVMQRMGGGAGQDPSASAGAAGGPDPMASAGGSPSAPPMAPPAAPPMAGPSASPSPMASASAGPAAPPDMAAPQEKSMVMPPALKSEAGQDDLKKAQEELAELKAGFNQVVGVLELLVNKPQRKSITSMAQFVAKSEADKPAKKQLARPEVMEQLKKITREPSLKKAERDSIDRYVYGDESALAEIEHLLK